MPFRPEHSLLRVEVPALHTIDTSSVENLFGMWSLFSKASHAMEDGKRLENLSWRLWNRETFCCAPESQARSTLSPRCSFTPKPKAATTNIPAVPELSTSFDSAVSDDLNDEDMSSLTATTIPNTRPKLRRDDSTSSTSRGREKHITPIDLEKIVISIKETKQIEPIELPIATPSMRFTNPPSTHTPQNTSSDRQCTQSSQQANTLPQVETSQPSILESSASTVDTNDSQTSQSQIVGSEDSSSTEMSTHSVVRGFVPGGAPSSYRSQTHLAAQPTPILKTSPQYQQSQPPKKKAPMFVIGTSSGDDESSLETRYKSSLSDGLRRNDGSDSSNGSRKQTTFKDEVAIGRAAEHSPVFESDDEEDEISESAIEEEDDSSDWEDSDEQSGPSSVNEKELFQRVDSRPNLTSRRSLLTTLMHEPDRAKALQNAASRSTPALRRSRTSTPNGPSVAASPEPGVQLPMPGTESRPQPIIMTTSNTHTPQLALSPRTTRRNMLSTELTESLRKNLLWERQHRSTGNLAALKRRHTAQDMTKLKQLPEPVALSQGERLKNLNNDYFHAGLQEYHAKGW
ncbi:hypothetical protein BAUCODRAFT_30156 [Baudoinia panamericana UAMH 10762]|uniref:Uncharacterized protein n=1 Tax=Baudoinia panamericana (strain UAMH 10762) TaxID=717646 RepID=M2NKT2_BAUPA|nr:uncharacterized protein BAUCODRAFT_30156 [Baudoinia panamericana UAMH 10762]EMC99755.1 hypothetical protein BAUCODRAFT_30156 [Baudoinia panamericana UAMH 10762]